SLAQYWCLTEDTSFSPANGIADACPDGQGDTNGWHSTRPTTLNLSAGDGAKTVRVWVADSNGDLLSHRYGEENIIYDSTPPGSFAITGVGGNSDTDFDEWLYSVDQPTISWGASTDSYEYLVEIFDSGNSLICQSPKVPSSATQFSFSNCQLDDGESYVARVT